MKVDFGATFKELTRFLECRGGTERQATDAPAANDFSRLLGSLSPESDRLKVIEEKSANLIEQAKTPGPHEPGVPMASFRFARPEQKADFLPRIEPNLDRIPQLESTVKTPALLEVRRVPIKNVVFDDSSSSQQIRNLIHAAGSEHGVDPMLSLAVASAESGFDSNAVSRDGFASKGVFQLLDSTATTLLKRSEQNATSYRPFDPQQNVDLGVRYLRYLHDVFSKPSELPHDLNTVPAANSAALEKLAVAAFNAGEGRVAAAQQQARRAGKDPGQYDAVEAYLPESTREYVMRVMSEKSRFESFVRS
ncbi:MAG: transglycosylase SLT domain-containing protein [Oligoflexia bacterium]|nr:transglycosylase SLT domain-containing protein [Oligoflexia bacterium]